MGDDMIPSDAEVVPVEGVFRTGDSCCDQTFRNAGQGPGDLTLAAGNKQKIRGKTVLVAGATGGVGSQVVQCLCNEGINARALVRDYTKVVWLLKLPVRVRETNICYGSDQVAMLLLH